jgi:hypothetical protein
MVFMLTASSPGRARSRAGATVAYGEEEWEVSLASVVRERKRASAQASSRPAEAVKFV